MAYTPTNAGWGAAVPKPKPKPKPKPRDVVPVAAPKSVDPYGALLAATPQQIAAERFRLSAAGPNYSAIKSPDFAAMQTSALAQAEERAQRLGAPITDERQFQLARQQVSNEAAKNFAAAFASILGGGNTNIDDPAAQKYSLENFGGSYLGGMAARMGQQLMMQAGDTFNEIDHKLASQLADIMDARPDEAEKIYEGLVSQAQELVKEQKTFADAEYKTQIAALAALESSKRKDGGGDGVPKVKNFSDGTSRQWNPKTGKWDVVTSKSDAASKPRVIQTATGVFAIDEATGRVIWEKKTGSKTKTTKVTTQVIERGDGSKVLINKATGKAIAEISPADPTGATGSTPPSASTTSNTVNRATTAGESVLTKMYDRIWKRMPGKTDEEANAAFEKYLAESGSKVFRTAMYQVVKAISPHLKSLGWTSAQVKAEAFRLVTSVGDEDGNVIKPPKGYKVPTAKPRNVSFNVDVVTPKTGIVTSKSWGGTHVTDNLDWNNGQKTAVDIMGKPGTPVGAPEDGVIIRHGSAQGGSSLYFKGASGKTYWLGHIDGMLPVGTRVRANQPIAAISSDHAAPHLHIDVTGRTV